MKLKAITMIVGLKDDPQAQTFPGEVFELEDWDQADELIDAGAAEECIEEDENSELSDSNTAQAMAKAALISQISTAATVGTLDILVPKDETDPGILAALDAKLAELNEPDH